MVATPLGNLSDLSPRAREALATADTIAAEDTRRTGNLLRALGLPKKPMLSYFAPKEHEKARVILDRLESGQTVVLVTDGGTPGISDPGSVLMRGAHDAGICVEPIPGPSAVALALSVSSAAGGAFVFEGFLPVKGGPRRKRLADFLDEPRPVVLYEAPHRIAALLTDAVAVLGGTRRATLVREGTKAFEEVVEAPLGELAERFAEGARGEFVLVLEGGTEARDHVTLDVAAVLQLALRAGLSPSQAAREVAELTGVPRSRLTRRARELGG
ncbi:MAG: 16S rRNA (cytidine(1402)-2'-O)-methyltransferase [Gemmatimonadetes bacterium]|nr:16S rRNA (cytidine(1402)-2'-O)-methyltransferase [Gemmatimonadota bacterium]